MDYAVVMRIMFRFLRRQLVTMVVLVVEEDYSCSVGSMRILTVVKNTKNNSLEGSLNSH